MKDLKKMRVLIADSLVERAVDRLRKYCVVDVKNHLSPEELRGVIGDYHAIVIRTETKVTKDILDAAKNSGLQMASAVKSSKNMSCFVRITPRQ